MKVSDNKVREDADLLNDKASPYYLIAKILRCRSPVMDKNDVGEKRAERVAWKSPVNFGIARGTTRDISASGVFFETDATCPLRSSSMRFEVELDTPDGKILLKCLGEIVRIEPRNKKVGVAVRINQQHLESAGPDSAFMVASLRYLLSDIEAARKLVQGLKVVVADAEELLRATANQAGERFAVAREKIQERLQRAKIKLAEAEDILVDKTRQMAHATDEYVHEDAWKAVGIAAGIGLIIGLLMGRRWQPVGLSLRQAANSKTAHRF